MQLTLNEMGKDLFILVVFYELAQKGGALLTLCIPCMLTELNCSFLTPTIATLTHTNSVVFSLLHVPMPRHSLGVLQQ